MDNLLIDVYDDAFSASSSADGSEPFAAKMFDMSIFARKGFSVPDEPYGTHFQTWNSDTYMTIFRCMDASKK